MSGYRPNPSGMKRIVRTLGGPAARAGAERGKAWAQANAPVRTGQYRASFRVEGADVRAGGETRKGARLVNTSDHARWVEYGNGAKHILRRSIDHIERG